MSSLSERKVCYLPMSDNDYPCESGCACSSTIPTTADDKHGEAPTDAPVAAADGKDAPAAPAAGPSGPSSGEPVSESEKRSRSNSVFNSLLRSFMSGTFGSGPFGQPDEDEVMCECPLCTTISSRFIVPTRNVSFGTGSDGSVGELANGKDVIAKLVKMGVDPEEARAAVERAETSSAPVAIYGANINGKMRTFFTKEEMMTAMRAASLDGPAASPARMAIPELFSSVRSNLEQLSRMRSEACPGSSKTTNLLDRTEENISPSDDSCSHAGCGRCARRRFDEEELERRERALRKFNERQAAKASKRLTKFSRRQDAIGASDPTSSCVSGKGRGRKSKALLKSRAGF